VTRHRRFWRALGGGLYRLLFSNFWLKLFSALIALGFYAFIHGTQDAERTWAVPLITYMPPQGHDRQLMTQMPNTISVTVGGLKAQLDGIRGENLGPLPIDLTDGTRRRVDFEPGMLNLPPRVQVRRIVPAAIDLKWESIVTRPIPVRVELTGELPSSLEVDGEPEMAPDAVDARGPASVLGLIHAVRVADFDLRGLTEGETVRELAIERAPDLVAWNTASVVVTVRIARKTESRTFSNVKVEVVGMPRATARPASVDVTIRGLPEQVARIRPDSDVPRVEPRKAITDVGPKGSAYLDVQVSLPDLDVEVLPAQVLVRW
jgi:hypothetical protein